MRSLTLRSPSKINLHLRVAGPDAGGFHPLRSWFVTTNLHDALSTKLAPTPGFARSIALRCDADWVPTDGSNLIVRAAERYLDAMEAIAPGGGQVAIDFTLIKRVPAGAGLGGGSSNAAAALLAIDTLLSRDHPRRPDLAALAAMLGSDVPFFLGPTSAIATGRGEHLTATPAPAARIALLILPPFGVATPAAYRTLDAIRPVAPADVLAPFDADAWSRLDARALSARLTNDLEQAAFALAPALGRLRSELEATLDRPVRMSGSGSTLFALFDSGLEATAAAGRIGDGSRGVVVRLGTRQLRGRLSSTIF